MVREDVIEQYGERRCDKRHTNYSTFLPGSNLCLYHVLLYNFQKFGNDKVPVCYIIFTTYYMTSKPTNYTSLELYFRKIFKVQQIQEEIDENLYKSV